MPVQINEVIIRTVVDAKPASQGAQTDAKGKDHDDSEAIEQVLEIIKEKQQR
jgi:hypothetical protein